MSEHKEPVIFDDPKDTWPAGKLVVLCVITLFVAFNILNFISDIGLKMPR